MTGNSLQPAHVVTVESGQNKNSENRKAEIMHGASPSACAIM